MRFKKFIAGILTAAMLVPTLPVFSAKALAEENPWDNEDMRIMFSDSGFRKFLYSNPEINTNGDITLDWN